MQSQEYIQNLGYKYAVCVAKIKYQQRDEVKMGFSPVHFTLPESKTIVGYKTHRLLSIAHTYLFSVSFHLHPQKGFSALTSYPHVSDIVFEECPPKFIPSLLL